MGKLPMKLKIIINNKLFKKFKKSKFHINKYMYNAARYKVRKMIFDKKRSFFEKKVK